MIAAETISHRRPEQVLAPAAELPLNYGNRVYLANGLQPLGIENLHFPNGDTLDMQVFGVLDLRASADRADSTVVLGRIIDEQGADKFVAAWQQQAESGKETSPRFLPLEGLDQSQDSADYTIPLGKLGQLRITQDPEKHRGWLAVAVERTKDADYSKNAVLKVAEASHPHRETPMDVENRKRSLRRWKRFGAVLLAVSAVRGVTAPGGLADRVMDPRQDAKEYVKEQLATTDDIPDEGEIRDGSRLTKAKLLASSEGEYYRAGDRVAQTMEDLDTHNYDAVRERAQSYIESNSEDLLSSESLEITKRQIEQAKSQEEVMDVMKSFLSKYGKEAELGDYGRKARVKSLKEAAVATIDAFSPLPRSLVMSGRFESVRYGYDKDNAPDGQGAYGSEIARYDGQSLIISLLDTLNYPVLKETRPPMVETIRHELTHALSPSEFEIISFFEPGTAEGLKRRLFGLASRMASRPIYTSDYAASEAEEERAETGREVLGGHVADPDHVGQFGSRANLKRLKALAGLEARYPGITDYLIVKLNPSLVR